MLSPRVYKLENCCPRNVNNSHFWTSFTPKFGTYILSSFLIYSLLFLLSVIMTPLMPWELQFFSRKLRYFFFARFLMHNPNIYDRVGLKKIGMVKFFWHTGSFLTLPRNSGGSNSQTENRISVRGTLKIVLFESQKH